MKRYNDAERGVAAMAGDPPLVAVRDLVKTFGGVAALHGATLTLRAGEIHALLGENGAGTSTLLKTLAGVHRADAGEIQLDGAP
jgi:ABC-type sugar transport system ATPase subunit